MCGAMIGWWNSCGRKAHIDPCGKWFWIIYSDIATFCAAVCRTVTRRSTATTGAVGRRAQIRQHFFRCRQQPQIIQNLFHEKRVQYAV